MRDVADAVGGEQRAPNLCGVIITLNEKPSLYLPADDWRQFVAWSELCLEDFSAEYFNRIYGWYAVGGLGAVAHHLATLGLAGYDAKRPPRQTVAFHDIAALSQAPEIGDTADVLGRLG